MLSRTLTAAASLCSPVMTLLSRELGTCMGGGCMRGSGHPHSRGTLGKPLHLSEPQCAHPRHGRDPNVFHGMWK